MNYSRTDTPRTNRDPAEVQRKQSLLHEPHIAPLTSYVERMRAERGRNYSIPYLDPTEAGITARIALLLEAPGPRSAHGSGFVSPDNDDQTAQNMWTLLGDVGCDRANEVVTWNVCPWYVGSGTKIRPVNRDDLDDARPAVEEFFSLVPDLRVAVLLGKAAARGWKHLEIDLPTIECPHPSPLSVNTAPGRRDQIRQALMDARRDAGYV